MVAPHILATRRVEALNRVAEVLSELGQEEFVEGVRRQSRGFASPYSDFVNVKLLEGLAEAVAASAATTKAS